MTKASISYHHTGVLIEEMINYLNPNDGFFIDCTLGGGEHTQKILEANPNNEVLAIDCDIVAIENGKKKLEKFKERVSFYHTNFRHIKKIPQEISIKRPIKGILMDIGVSSHHLDESKRGFSYRMDAPLDMRMNQSEALTAMTIVNTWSKDKLNDIICNYGEEKHHKIIVEAIIRGRQEKPWQSTLDLATMLDKVLRRWHKQSLPAPTKTFQALRIAVNDELNSLQQGLEDSFELLDEGGNLIVISFHSLEDRIVKKYFRQLTTPKDKDPFSPNRHQTSAATMLTKKPITANSKEIKNNSRSACAKLRAIKKNKLL